MPAFEAQWEQAVQDVGCKAPKTGKCKRLNEKVTFYDISQQAKDFDRYGKAKKFFKQAAPDFDAIYDFEQLDGTIGVHSSATCTAFQEMYQDASDNPDQYRV